MLTREGISDETSFLCGPFDGHLSSIGNTQTTSAQTSHDADVHELERLETVWMELTSTVTSAMRNTMLSCMFSDLPFRYAAPHRSL